MEEAARAAGMATEVILSRGPFRYACLWILWKYFCFSNSFSLGLKGASDILHHLVRKKIGCLNIYMKRETCYNLKNREQCCTETKERKIG